MVRLPEEEQPQEPQKVQESQRVLMVLEARCLAVQEVGLQHPALQAQT
jgi:hypothetical protein